MIRIGIDPGITGAIAVLDIEDLVAVYDMPILTSVGGKNEINIPELAAILRCHHYGFKAKVILERVSAMRGQGVTSMFNFGMGYGAVRGIVQTLGIEIELVTPQTWKKAAKIVGTPKDYARTRALELYPDAELSLKKHVGRADAILIARYG